MFMPLGIGIGLISISPATVSTILPDCPLLLSAVTLPALRPSVHVEIRQTPTARNSYPGTGTSLKLPDAECVAAEEAAAAEAQVVDEADSDDVDDY